MDMQLGQLVKRPAGTKPSGRKTAKRAPKADPIDDLKARLEEAELDSTFNARTDEVSLDELFVLLVDMIAALKTHGVTPDEAFAKVDPANVWRDYLAMWREQHLRLEQVTRKYSEQPDEVFYHADAVAAHLERRERIAWRLWLCQRALGDLRDETLRQHLEALRVAKLAPRKKAA
jgi:hypothetical protein